MDGILAHPQAQALLADATVSAEQVAACRERLTAFLQRYLPLFARREQRDNATLVLHGKLSGLERKTSEPIANQAGVHRKPLQSFVGWGHWDDDALMAEVRHHVAHEWADANAVFVLDGSGFPKKGTHSCGAARQWCGRLGKIDNCQVGIFLIYACRHGHAPLDRRLFLPKDWAADRTRRHKCHVPKDVVYQERWQIGLDLIDRATDLPHSWVAGDDDFGRVSAFRAALRQRGKRYVLDVPGQTLVRDLEVPPPPRRPGRGGAAPKVPFVRAEQWAAEQPESRWERFVVRGGEKGPVAVEALEVRVQTKEGKRVGAEERLVVLRPVGPKGQRSYHLSNAGAGVPLAAVIAARGERVEVEQVFAEGNGEVGLDHYEVRRWDGWHHHMTLSLLALWFLALQRGRIGGEKDTRERGAGARDSHAAATAARPHPRGGRHRDQPCSAA